MDNISRLEYGTDDDDMISFAIVGDIMMARTLGKAIQDHYNNDSTIPFRQMRPYLQDIDIKIANMEAAITESNEVAGTIKPCGLPSSNGCCGLNCRFKVNETVFQGITDYAGFNLLSIENNHMDDYKSGRNDTINALKNHSVPFMDMNHPLRLKNYKGCDLNFFTYDLVRNKSTHAYRKNVMRHQLSVAKETGGFNVVYLHGGSEYKFTPTRKLQNWAKQAIRDGADIVFSTHPHVVLGMEIYRGKHIYYSLGNFVADQQGSEAVKETLMVKFDLFQCRDVLNFEYIRGRINEYYQPVMTSVSSDFKVGMHLRTKREELQKKTRKVKKNHGKEQKKEKQKASMTSDANNL